jgi:hypothetical protein
MALFGDISTGKFIFFPTYFQNTIFAIWYTAFALTFIIAD